MKQRRPPVRQIVPQVVRRGMLYKVADPSPNENWNNIYQGRMGECVGSWRGHYHDSVWVKLLFDDSEPTETQVFELHRLEEVNA